MKWNLYKINNAVSRYPFSAALLSATFSLTLAPWDTKNLTYLRTSFSSAPYFTSLKYAAIASLPCHWIYLSTSACSAGVNLGVPPPQPLKRGRTRQQKRHEKKNLNVVCISLFLSGVRLKARTTRGDTVNKTGTPRYLRYLQENFSLYHERAVRKHTRQWKGCTPCTETLQVLRTTPPLRRRNFS